MFKCFIIVVSGCYTIYSCHFSSSSLFLCIQHLHNTWYVNWLPVQLLLQQVMAKQFLCSVLVLMMQFQWRFSYASCCFSMFTVCCVKCSTYIREYDSTLYVGMVQAVTQWSINHRPLHSRVYVGLCGATSLYVGTMVNAPLCNSLYLFLYFLCHPYVHPYYFCRKSLLILLHNVVYVAPRHFTYCR